MKSVRWLLAVALAVGLLLTGCSAPRPSVAATVGGVTITEAQLESTTATTANVLAGDPAVVRPAVLRWLILGQIARTIDAEKGLGLTDAQREQSATGSALAALLASEATRDFALNGGDVTYVANKLGSSQAFAAAAEGVRVSINPRHGTWDGQRLDLTKGSGPLSEPFTPAGGSPSAPASAEPSGAAQPSESPAPSSTPTR